MTDRTHRPSTEGSTPPRLRAIGATLALGLLAIAGWVWAAGPTPTGADTAGQTDPTSTPIRLIAFTPVAEPTADGGEEPTGEAVIVVIKDDETPEGRPDEFAVEFEADDWEGGYFRGDGEWYGRAWTAVYGAESEYPAATLTFDLETVPDEDLVFAVVGLNDEVSGKNPIALEINGRRVYEGECPFASWDGSGQGEDAAWTQVHVTLPPDLFAEGENEITILNLSPSAAFNAPPYILLSVAAVTTESALVSFEAEDDNSGEDGDDDDDDDDDDGEDGDDDSGGDDDDDDEGDDEGDDD